MIRDIVFDPELTKPPVGQVDLDLSAEPAFRTERKYVDLSYQVIRRHDLVEIKGIKELALTALLPP
jgi:hypothetical protein